MGYACARHMNNSPYYCEGKKTMDKKKTNKQKKKQHPSKYGQLSMENKMALLCHIMH